MSRKGFSARPLSPVFDPQIGEMTKRLGASHAVGAARRPTEIDRLEAETRSLREGFKDIQSGKAEPSARRAVEPEAPPDPSGTGASKEYKNSALHVAKNCLNGGEMSSQMGARYDQPRFQTGCHYLLNMVPMPCGGITKRPGLVHRDRAKAFGKGGKARLVPFIFSPNEARMLEFYGVGANVRLRVWKPDGTAIEPELLVPWKEEWLKDVRFCQSADVLFCASTHFAPGKLMRYGDNDWRYETIAWEPAIGAPEIVSAYGQGTWPEGNRVWTAYNYVVTAMDDEGNISSPSRNFTAAGLPDLSDQYWAALEIKGKPGAAEYRIYKKEAGVYGFIGRCEPDESGHASFNDTGYAPDTEDAPLKHKNPFGKAGDYPAVCFLHQQRLGFAATDNKPLTVWLSQAGYFESMGASLPPKEDDAIEATLAAAQANRILWAQSDRSGLVLGTAGGEWMMVPGEGSALTPKDLSFQPQSNHGSEPGTEPLKTGSSLVLLQRGGQVVRNLDYSFQDDRYGSSDLSLLSRHILAGNPVRAWCWQPEPFGIVWCALKDGSMAGLTYLKEHEVVSWHRHKTLAQNEDKGAAKEEITGRVADLASIPDDNGNWQVWALVERLGILYVETPADFRREEADWLADDWKADRSGDYIHKDGIAQTTFRARCAPCLGEANLDNGSTFLRCRKINAIKARVVNSKPFRARVRSMNAADSLAVGVPPRGGKFVSEAEWACPVGAGFRDFARVELIMDGPDPVTILGLTVIMEFASEGGGQWNG